MVALVGYIRVSSESQKDNASLVEQREAIEAFCKTHDHELVTVFQEVESAADIAIRDQLQWALRVVFACADGLIVYKLDRFCRRVLDSEKLKEEFQAHEKQLISVLDHVDLHTDDGEFMYAINGAVAELERKKIAKRCHFGRRRKFDNGGYVGGNPPYGFIAWGRTLMEAPREQEILKQIKQMYAEGLSTTLIAKILNDAGIPSKRGTGWCHPVVYKLIMQGESPVVARLRASGQLKTVEDFYNIYGKARAENQSQLGADNNQASA